jgi:RNA polymerase sigma-70 factor (ECF subfamily)
MRIIFSRYWYQERQLEKVNNEPSKQNRTGFAEGDGEVWREFLSQIIPQLYGMFMKSWPNRSLAEELVQRSVFDAVRGRGSYEASKGSPEEWIFGIARNNIRLEIRRRASRGGIDGDISGYLELIDSKPLPEEVIERRETAEIVRTALGKLQSKEQEVLRAKYIEGLSAREIAGRIGGTEKAVHSLLYRARNLLAQEIKRIAPLYKEEQEL